MRLGSSQTGPSQHGQTSQATTVQDKKTSLTTEPYCMVQWSETDTSDSDTVNIVIPMNIKYHFHVTVAGKNIRKEKQNTDMPTRMLNFKK